MQDIREFALSQLASPCFGSIANSVVDIRQKRLYGTGTKAKTLIDNTINSKQRFVPLAIDAAIASDSTNAENSGFLLRRDSVSVLALPVPADAGVIRYPVRMRPDDTSNVIPLGEGIYYQIFANSSTIGYWYVDMVYAVVQELGVRGL